jgi:NifB/MoaA-like Fe-S oxidoreductase
LHGNFVTLTNLADEEVQRIITMHLSPFNVSLHAVDPHIREQMMGRSHSRGIEVLEELLTAGIEFKVQIVLMPGINDGAVLDETLLWISDWPGIIATGIVPYGYTRFAKIQSGYDTSESAHGVIKHLEPWGPQIQLADEFYLKAWPGEALQHLPAAEHYDGYPLLQDGVGMLRQWLDSHEPQTLLALLRANEEQVLVTGEAFAKVLHQLWPELQGNIFPIKNNFFGGNVDVAGLLTAQDIIEQMAHSKAKKLLLPAVLFNDEGLTLDDKAASDIERALEKEVQVIS